MKRTLTALVVAIAILASSPVRSGYYDAATMLRHSNENAAWAWYYAVVHLFNAEWYDYVDYSLVYNAWSHSKWARDQAWSAWYQAPSGSYAEYWALQTYYQLAALEQNLWTVYTIGGAYLSSATSEAINNALWGQVYLSYASQAAAGQF